MWLRNVAGALGYVQGSDCDSAVRCVKTVNGLSGDNVLVITNSLVSQVSLSHSNRGTRGYRTERTPEPICRYTS
jgi:hypothetical protein